MIHWYLFDVCFAPFREPSHCTFIGFSLFVFLSRSFLRFLPTVAATVIMFCFYELWNCYWFYTTLLYISPTVLPQCLPRCECVSVFLICWLVCFCFRVQCICITFVFVKYKTWLSSLFILFVLVCLCFFTISATYGLFYFIIYKYISVFYLTLSASSFESDAILSRSLGFFSHTVTTHVVKYVKVCVCVWKGANGIV